MDAELKDTNQHFVTRAHLEHFIHPSMGQAVLFPYRKGGNRCKARGVKRLGSAENFYRQRDCGKFTDKLDQNRSYLESMLFANGKGNPGSLAKCVSDDTFEPSDEDRANFAEL